MRRFLQFKLGSLLALMCLLCLFFGLWVQPIRARTEAMFEIHREEGVVFFEAGMDTQPAEGVPRWMPRGYSRVDMIAVESSKGLHAAFEIREVKSLRLSHFASIVGWEIPRHDPIDLRPLVRLTMLEELSLNGLPITDLAPIAELKKLRKLSLVETGVTDLRPLAELGELRDVSLQRTAVVDLGPLEGLRNLEQVDVRDTAIREDQARAFERQHPGCRVFCGAWYRHRS